MSFSRYGICRCFRRQILFPWLNITPGFKFEEGIFLNFDQVKQNKPIPKSRIITTIPYDDPDFYDRILQGKENPGI